MGRWRRSGGGKGWLEGGRKGFSETWADAGGKPSGKGRKMRVVESIEIKEGRFYFCHN